MWKTRKLIVWIHHVWSWRRRHSVSFWSKAYAREAEGCPSIQDLNAEVDGQLFNVLAVRRYDVRSYVKRVLAMLFASVLVISVGNGTSGLVANWVTLDEVHYRAIVAIVAYCIELVGFVMTVRAMVSGVLEVDLFQLICHIERSPRSWTEHSSQKEICRELQSVARSVADYPRRLGFRRTARHAYPVLVETARRQAASISELQYWVLAPGPFTYTDLLARLTLSLELIMSGNWILQPQEAAVRRESRARRILLTCVALAAFGGLVALAIFNSRFGPAGYVVSTVLGLVVVAVLQSLGISIATMNSATDLVGKVVKSDDK